MTKEKQKEEFFMKEAVFCGYYRDVDKLLIEMWGHYTVITKCRKENNMV